MMSDQGDSESPKSSDLALPGFDDEVLKAEIGTRLRQAVKIGGGNKAVAAKSGIPLRSLGNLVGGQAPNVIQLVRIAEACGVSVDWLATGRLPVHPLERLEPLQDTSPVVAAGCMEGYVLVPRYDVRASAGGGSVVHSEQVVDHLAFKADWVRNRLGVNPAHLLLLEAVGDSMEPTISDGDLLLVSTYEPRIRDNAIYALNVSGDLMVKRVQKKLDGTLVVSSDNPRYSAEEVEARNSDLLRVIGQVLWHGGLI